jgi:5-methylcytosine-specific restriction endonuclease McrA
MARVKLDDIERTAFKKAYNSKCYMCNFLKTNNELEIDHIIPPNKREEAINMGVIDADFGIDSYDNYAPICRPCNLNKSDMLLSNVSVFIKKAEQKLPKVKDEIDKLRKKHQKELNEAEIQITVNEWEKSGYFNNPKILNLLSEKVNQYTKEPGTYISLKTESAIEVVGNKLIKEHELDNFITKIQTSQEMVFGYGNTSCLVLEEGIQFYPLSIYLSHKIWYNKYNKVFLAQN